MKAFKAADVAAVLVSLGFASCAAVRVDPAIGKSRFLLVVDQLLGRETQPGRTVAGRTAPATPLDAEISQRLTALRQAFDKGLISQQEYDAKQASLISRL